MPLILDTGISTLKGRREENNDACLVSVPASLTESVALIAIGDSVSGPNDEESAANSAVNTLRESFFAAPENWSMERRLDESYKVIGQTLSSPGLDKGSSSLSALVIDTTSWIMAHLGNTRIWLMRDQKLRQVSRDHIEPAVRGKPKVTRLCGPDQPDEVDTQSGELREDDIFVLSTDGVHETLDGTALLGCLLRDNTAQQMADEITRTALQKGSTDNISTCVIRVENLPENVAARRAPSADRLDIGPLPEKGDVVDNFYVIGMVYKSPTTVMFKATDQESGKTVALKFPNPKLAAQPGFKESFGAEEWTGRRLDSPYLMKTLNVKPGRRSRLYSVLEYSSGETLGRRIHRKKQLPVREALYLIKQVAECVQFLHAKGIIHGDITPQNIFIDKHHKRVVVASYGLLALSAKNTDNARQRLQNANLNYSAPELFQDRPFDKRIDVFSIGVLFYKMLTGHYPYGRVKKLDDLLHGKFTAPTKYNPMIPPWVSDVIERACALKTGVRFRDAESFLEAIDYLPDELAASSRKSVGLWKKLLLLSIAINLIVIVTWLVLSRL